MQRRPLMCGGLWMAAAALMPRAGSAAAAQEKPARHAKRPPVVKTAAPRRAPAAAKPAPADPQPGPGITTEAELPSVYPGAIAAFWSTGTPGEFLSTRGEAVRIRFMRFLRPGADTAIVIASGRTECLIKYKEMVFDLYRNGYSVFIHDHRGQGFSSRLLADPMIGYVDEFDDYVADMKTFYDVHVRPAGHRRHVLLGHSMGGCIGSLYLEKHQRDFDSAVLSSPMHEPRLPAEEASLFAVGLMDSMGMGERYIPFGHPYQHVRDFDPATNEFTHSRLRWEITWDEFNASPAVEPNSPDLGSPKLGSPSVHWVRVAYAAGRQAQDGAGRIVVPVLLLQAGADSVVQARAQDRFHARLNAIHPDSCTLIRIEGARHELFVEADAYRTPAIERILAFLAPPG